MIRRVACALMIASLAGCVGDKAVTVSRPAAPAAQSAEDAELERVLASIRAKHGPDSKEEFLALLDIAGAEPRLWRKEALLRRVHAMAVATRGHNDILTVMAAAALGEFLTALNLSEEGREILQQAVSAMEKLAPRDPNLGMMYVALANACLTSSCRDQAGGLAAKGVTLTEKFLTAPGDETLRKTVLAASLHNAAMVFRDLGDLNRARELMGRVLEANPKSGNHLEMSNIEARAGNFDGQLHHARKAVELAARPPENHLSLATARFSLAKALVERGHYDQGLQLAREAQPVIDREVAAMRGGRPTSEQVRLLNHFKAAHVVHALALAARPGATAADVGKAFELAQAARASETAGVVAATAARLAAKSDDLAQAIRERDDLFDRLRHLDARLLTGQGAANPAERARLRSEHDAVLARIGANDALLARKFPAYFDLISPDPATVADVRAVLRDGEAVVLYLLDGDAALAFLIDRRGATVAKLQTRGAELDGLVASIRRSIQPTDDGRVRRFPLADAHRLYTILLAPFEERLKDVDHLMVVPDGPLWTLPPAMLVQASPARSDARADELTDVPWLARRMATSVLPSAASLKVLRRVVAASSAPNPFVGIGDPMLDDHPPVGSPSMRGRLAMPSAPSSLVLRRGLAGDTAALRQLPSLPETADELKALAAILKADTRAVLLREQATLPNVRRKLRLKDYRVVAFATHGLLAGDFTALSEPALLLTPPRSPTPDDDGLLTASRIAELSMDADWVILSACNTAAPDGSSSGAGLSGLSRAFFHAGSRALLVSHWAVSSEATARLTTEVMRAWTAAPISQAEALRRASLRLMGEKDYAHPLFWAPFVVVGGTARR